MIRTLPKSKRVKFIGRVRVRKQRKTGRASLARLADQLCGQIVRARGACEECGGCEVLQWAHGFSRSYKATRWFLINGFCLCRGCHFRYTNDPLAWDDFLRLAWGSGTYEELRRVAQKGARVDLEATIQYLRDEHERSGL